MITLVQESPDHARVWEKIFDEISILSGIAKTNGSIVRLKDLAALTRTSLSEDQILSSWETFPKLAASYRLKDGFILQPGNDHLENDGDSLALEKEKRTRAETYTQYANEFASLCDARGTALLAISGSTSYKTPFAFDDLDVFCVTKPNSLWIFLTKSLLLARFQQLFRRDAPRLCFSYAVDQNFVEKEFPLRKDALFARDALTATILHGQNYYKELLKKSPWISDYFPRLYQDRTDMVKDEGITRERLMCRPATKFLNTLLQVTVGNYVAFKSTLLNMRLRKQRRLSALFSAKIGTDHCIFESARYSKLRAMYRQLDERSGPIHPGEPLAAK